MLNIEVLQAGKYRQDEKANAFGTQQLAYGK